MEGSTYLDTDREFYSYLFLKFPEVSVLYSEAVVGYLIDFSEDVRDLLARVKLRPGLLG